MIIELRIGEEVARNILARRDLEDGLRADTLVNVECNGIDDEAICLALPGPFEPRLLPP